MRHLMTGSLEPVQNAATAGRTSFQEAIGKNTQRLLNVSNSRNVVKQRVKEIDMMSSKYKVQLRGTFLRLQVYPRLKFLAHYTDRIGYASAF